MFIDKIVFCSMVIWSEVFQTHVYIANIPYVQWHTRLYQWWRVRIQAFVYLLTWLINTNNSVNETMQENERFHKFSAYFRLEDTCTYCSCEWLYYSNGKSFVAWVAIAYLGIIQDAFIYVTSADAIWWGLSKLLPFFPWQHIKQRRVLRTGSRHREAKCRVSS